MNRKIFIKTFGCQMNEYDSNRIYDTVKEIGFAKTENYEDANCYLLNTCHIRDKAKEKVYHEIGRVKKIFRSKEKPLVIIAGCVAQAENDEMLKREPYIDLVIGPQSYHKINDTILNYIEKKNKIEETDFDAVSKFQYLSKIKNNLGKVSSFLTIQEGCDKFCHFCVVPYTRGPEYSRPFNQIIDEAKYQVENGTKEIILLGQNVNAYESEGYKLSNLILEIEKISKLKRIRYTTSHPKDMTEDLIEVYKESKKLMPLVHLPVQSGSNKILDLMNRKHTISEYLKIYDKLKKINSNIEFSSDFIIGYPGEEDQDFEDTLDLIKKIKFIPYTDNVGNILCHSKGQIFCSLKEGSPKSFFESLYCEVPVIATPVGAFPELLDNEFISSDLSYDSIKKVIIHWTARPKELLKKQKDLISSIKKNHIIKKASERILKIYES